MEGRRVYTSSVYLAENSITNTGVLYFSSDRYTTTNAADYATISQMYIHVCTYGVYISQLIRIGRICEDFSAFTERHYKLTSRLIKQGFWYNKLCVAFKKFSLNHMDIF